MNRPAGRNQLREKIDRLSPSRTIFGGMIVDDEFLDSLLSCYKNATLDDLEAIANDIVENGFFFRRVFIAPEGVSADDYAEQLGVDTCWPGRAETELIEQKLSLAE